MFYHLLDLLICPACKNELVLLAPNEKAQTTSMRLRPARRPSRMNASVGPLPEKQAQTQLGDLLAPLAASPAADRRESQVSILTCVLACPFCERWYPVSDGLPELLPDYLRRWDEEKKWLGNYASACSFPGMNGVWERLLDLTPPPRQMPEEPGVHYKKAEMTVLDRQLPESFLGPAALAPFNPSTPNFTLDLIASFVTIGARLGCGMNGVVFDLGCGSAWTTEWLVRLGYQAIGLDICRAYILAGQTRAGKHLPHLIVGDVECLPLRSACVDAAISYEAFHHIPNREQAMQEIGRIMRPGARLVMIEPGAGHESNPRSVQVMKEHGILERGFDKDDLVGYTRKTTLRRIRHERTDVHPHDIFILEKDGAFQTDSLSPRALVADLKVTPEHGHVAIGNRPEIELTITNTGDTTWLHHTLDGIGEVHLGAKLFDGQHHLIDENYARVILPRSLKPGQRIQIRCPLPSLATPGRYIVEFDMVDNGFLWFQDYAYQPFSWPLEVEDRIQENQEIKKDIGLPSEPDSHIIPVELAFDPDPEDLSRVARSQKNPLVLLLKSFSILRKEGLTVLSRKVQRRLRRKSDK
jgi:uncharacterized protein YbaR (Trm112 family)/SAM-dependent methyltransferase